jgi:ankyrin repeat protein
MTPLMDAARRNPNPEVISVLLKAGADVNTKDNEGKTALDYAKENEELKGTQAIKELEAATNP